MRQGHIISVASREHAHTILISQESKRYAVEAASGARSTRQPEARRVQHAHQSMMRPTNGEMSAAPASAHAAACDRHNRVRRGRCRGPPHRHHATRCDQAPSTVPTQPFQVDPPKSKHMHSRAACPALLTAAGSRGLCCQPWPAGAGEADQAGTPAPAPPPERGKPDRDATAPGRRRRAASCCSLCPASAAPRTRGCPPRSTQSAGRPERVSRSVQGPERVSGGVQTPPRSAAAHTAACGRCAASARRRRLVLQPSCAGGLGLPGCWPRCRLRPHGGQTTRRQGTQRAHEARGRARARGRGRALMYRRDGSTPFLEYRSTMRSPCTARHWRCERLSTLSGTARRAPGQRTHAFASPGASCCAAALT